MRNYRKFRDVLIEDLRDDPAHALAYLQVAFEEYDADGDIAHLLLALRTVAEAQGGTAALASRVGMREEEVALALSESGGMDLGTIHVILRGLGYRLLPEPTERAG